METNISKVITATDHKAAYDQEIKQILANKEILSVFLENVVPDFKGVPRNKIIESIEGTPEIGTHPVSPGLSRKIAGMNTESVIEDEGRVYFDVRCYALTPNREQVKVFINIEAQGKYNPGYPLTSRGVFYCARMLSEQMDVEFTDDDYGRIKKVYSIWVCINVPNYAKQSIVSFDMAPSVRYGNFPLEKARGYDLLSVIMLHLDDKDEPETHPLLGMLYTLIKAEISAKDKKSLLESRYGINVSGDLSKEVDHMCDVSVYVEERGIEKGRAEGGNLMVYALVRDGDLSPEKGAKRLGITVEQLRANMINTGYEWPE